MSNINYNDISLLISNWLQEISEEQIQGIEDELIKKATNIVVYLHPKNTDEVFLQLCALNLLNAAIKTEKYKDQLSYDLIRSNAAKLVTVIDNLKKDSIAYYYDKDESCLYFEISGVVFSFHHVPLTSEILKASFANPIIWPGIRLQKIAQPLLNYAISSFDEDVEIKEILGKVTHEIKVKRLEKETDYLQSYEKQDNRMINNDATSINYSSTETIAAISNEEKNKVRQEVLAVISQNCAPDSEGWYDLIKIAPKLKAHGVDYSLYGFQKLILFLEAIFGDSMQRKNVGSTIVYLKFPLYNREMPTYNNSVINQNTIGILSGVKIGDDVEISTYGILKNGRISILNKQFVQLELDNNKSVRIKCDAISSIESIFSLNNITPIDFSPVFRASLHKELNYPKNQAVARSKFGNLGVPR